MGIPHTITDADLLRLGLDPIDASPDVHIIAKDQPREARGSVSTPVCDQLEAISYNLRTREESAPDLERFGIQIERGVDQDDRTLWRLIASDPLDWVGTVPTGAASREGVIFVDSTQLNGYYTLSLSSRGLGLVIKAEGNSELHLRCGRLQSRPDLLGLARETGDAWLVSEVEERLPEDGDLLGLVVAAGFLSRMRVDQPAQLREKSRALLEGRYEPRFDPERAWARTLGQRETQQIEDRALAWVDRLEAELGDLGSEMEPEDSAWHACMRRVLVGRDDLEGVVILLEESGAGVRLRRALERLDHEAEVQIRSLPTVDLSGEHELVRRAVLLDPAAWWVRPLLRGQ